MEIIKGDKVALLIGGNSLVGKHCLELLTNNAAYEHIFAFSREKPFIEHPRLSWIALDEKRTDLLMPQIKGHDLFWCRSAFSDWVDITSISSVRNSLPFKIALEALDQGASQLIFLSSRIVSKNAWLPILKERSFLEQALIQLPFWSTHVFKPVFVNENFIVNKGLESIVGQLADWVGEEVREFQPIPPRQLAEAMIEAAQILKSGLHFHYAKDLQKI